MSDDLFKKILREYEIEDFQSQILRYHETYAEQIQSLLPSDQLLSEWRKNGFYFGHYKTGLGEILSYTAIPRYLKKYYPEIKVYFCGHRFAKALYRSNPYVDGVVDFKDRQSYGSGREFGFGTTTQRRLRSFGIFTAEALGPEVYVSREVLNRWQEWRNSLPLKGRKLVLVQSSGRTNPKVFSFWSWLRYLRSMRDEFYFVQIGNLRDQFIWAHEVRLKQWDMEDLAGILKVADAFIGPNSGVMHLASSVGTNSVILHNEALASEMMFPILSDNWLLPKKANSHLFHAYPWHHHIVINKLWDLKEDSALFCRPVSTSNIRESIRAACQGPNPAWESIQKHFKSEMVAMLKL